jgi:hypothetical protein
LVKGDWLDSLIDELLHFNRTGSYSLIFEFHKFVQIHF